MDILLTIYKQIRLEYLQSEIKRKNIDYFCILTLGYSDKLLYFCNRNQTNSYCFPRLHGKTSVFERHNLKEHSLTRASQT